MGVAWVLRSVLSAQVFVLSLQNSRKLSDDPFLEHGRVVHGVAWVTRSSLVSTQPAVCRDASLTDDGRGTARVACRPCRPKRRLVARTSTNKHWRAGSTQDDRCHDGQMHRYDDHDDVQSMVLPGCRLLQSVVSPAVSSAAQ
jgi:hypothetical protein